MQGLIWVWPGDAERACDALLPHHLFREYGQEEWGYDWVTRDFELYFFLC